MGNLVIKDSTSKTTFEYSNDKMIAQGEYEKGLQGKLKTVKATCFHKNQDGTIGTNFGNFNGIMRADDKVHYSMSEMSREDSTTVWDAIDEMEPEIIGEDEDNKEKTEE